MPNQQPLHGSTLPSFNCLGGGCGGGVASAVAQIREKGTATPCRRGLCCAGCGEAWCGGLLKCLRSKLPSLHIGVQYSKLNASSPTHTRHNGGSRAQNGRDATGYCGCIGGLGLEVAGGNTAVQDVTNSSSCLSAAFFKLAQLVLVLRATGCPICTLTFSTQSCELSNPYYPVDSSGGRAQDSWRCHWLSADALMP